jgi:hypothetical protein
MKKESIEEVAKNFAIKEIDSCDSFHDLHFGFIEGYNYSQQEISELKEQRDEMLQMLEEIRKYQNYDGVEQLIKKVKNEN